MKLNRVQRLLRCFMAARCGRTPNRIQPAFGGSITLVADGHSEYLAIGTRALALHRNHARRRVAPRRRIKSRVRESSPNTDRAPSHPQDHSEPVPHGVGVPDGACVDRSVALGSGVHPPDARTCTSGAERCRLRLPLAFRALGSASGRQRRRLRRAPSGPPRPVPRLRVGTRASWPLARRNGTASRARLRSVQPPRR